MSSLAPHRLLTGTLATLALALGLVLVWQKYRARVMDGELKTLTEHMPHLTQEGEQLPRVALAKAVDSHCRRYYVAIGPGQRVRPALFVGNQRIQYDLVEGRERGRLFQLWIGYSTGRSRVYLMFQCEELTDDGQAIVRNGDTPRQRPGFVGHSEFSFESETARFVEENPLFPANELVFLHGDEERDFRIELDVVGEEESRSEETSQW